MLALFFFFHFIVDFVSPILPLFIESLFPPGKGGVASTTGTLYAISGGAAALTAGGTGYLSDRVQHRSLLVALGLLGVTASLAGYGLSRRPLHFNLSAVAMGGYNSAIYLGMMVSAAGLGPIISRIGFADGFLLATVITLLITGISYLLMKGFSPPERRPANPRRR